ELPPSMMISPASSNGDSSPIVSSTTAAGTISQIARGRSSFLTKSAREVAPIALSLTRSLTALCERSNATHVCPFFSNRRTMFAPIRPRPIIPICIVNSLLSEQIVSESKSKIRGSKSEMTLFGIFCFLSFEFVSKFGFLDLNVSHLSLVRCRSEPVHGCDYSFALTKNCRSGYQNVGSCIDHQWRGRHVDAAVNLEIAVPLGLIDHPADTPNLWQRRVDETLVSKARVNCHD